MDFLYHPWCSRFNPVGQLLRNDLWLECSGMSTVGIVFYQMKGFQLSLYNRDSLAEDAPVEARGSGFKTVTISYLTRSEAEVDDTIEMLRSKGVTIIKEPQHVFWGGYSSYIADPDCHLWEIAYIPFVISEL